MNEPTSANGCNSGATLTMIDKDAARDKRDDDDDNDESGDNDDDDDDDDDDDVSDDVDDDNEGDGDDDGEDDGEEEEEDDDDDASLARALFLSNKPFFFVVAEEVRNLALRAAQAAKETSLLIEGTVGKVKDGTGLLEVTNKQFIEVAKSALKVAELVGEISAASREQALGIEQVSKAVTEMERVVQRNAASAEESASAAQEMSSQAAVLKKEVVEKLLVVIGGGNNHAVAPAAIPQTKEKQEFAWTE